MRMMTAGVSDPERDILRHALGLDRARVSYRNSYSATPQADTYAVCMGLVNRGLMERGAYHETMVYFYVTDAGKALVMG
jgi:hypothetical protein